MDGSWVVRWMQWVLVDYKQKTGADASDTTYHFSSQDNREVIDNIHANPELMEK
jgi:hypothetical protein